MKLAGAARMLGLLLVVSCSSAQSGRMESYLGPNLTNTVTTAEGPVRIPADGLKAALFIVNDTTDPRSAPPLSAPYLALIESLLREQLEQNLPIRIVAHIPSSTITDASGTVKILELGRGVRVEHVLFAVLSSQDEEEPVYLGQGYMMMQMPGVTVTNHALMEIALIDVGAETVLVHAGGHGREYLNELDVPLGHDVPSKTDARDILRVNAAKHALDRAIPEFTTQFRRMLLPSGL